MTARILFLFEPRRTARGQKLSPPPSPTTLEQSAQRVVVGGHKRCPAYLKKNDDVVSAIQCASSRNLQTDRNPKPAKTKSAPWDPRKFVIVLNRSTPHLKASPEFPRPLPKLVVGSRAMCICGQQSIRLKMRHGEGLPSGEKVYLIIKSRRLLLGMSSLHAESRLYADRFGRWP